MCGGSFGGTVAAGIVLAIVAQTAGANGVGDSMSPVQGFSRNTSAGVTDGTQWPRTFGPAGQTPQLNVVILARRPLPVAILGVEN